MPIFNGGKQTLFEFKRSNKENTTNHENIIPNINYFEVKFQICMTFCEIDRTILIEKHREISNKNYEHFRFDVWNKLMKNKMFSRS